MIVAFWLKTPGGFPGRGPFPPNTPNPARGCFYGKSRMQVMADHFKVS